MYCTAFTDVQKDPSPAAPVAGLGVLELEW